MVGEEGFSQMTISRHYQTYLLAAALIATPIYAMPNIKTEFGRSADGMVRIKVINDTNRNLQCYVGIDGRKIKFALAPFKHSKWYKATDSRYTYKSFTTWCDYTDR